MPEEPNPVEDALHEPPTVEDVEDAVRANIRSVLAVTNETLTDIGNLLELSVAVVGRRQRGVTPWSVAELGRLAGHWEIEVSKLFASRTTVVLSALRPGRIAQLRAAKGLPAHSRAKASVAA
ncbi:helix-turn-helix domain-containing protein (plasmid) [Streptomyces sp. NBC_00015]|uniref:helix-turn-helix domain-containing protein n=1 Tax=Streptomyces sp. NBC_00015 TaxID=2903611 RepID=UPI002F9137D3